MPMIPLDCPCCGASLTINSDLDAVLCNACGKPFAVKEAIVKTYLSIVAGKHTESAQAESVNEKSVQAESAAVTAQADFVITHGVLEKYNGASINVVIPDGVIEIGDEAFAGSAIGFVKIPDGVESIGASAFENCAGLQSVVIPKSVRKIGSGAFRRCSALMSVTIENSATKIWHDSFQGTPWARM